MRYRANESYNIRAERRRELMYSTLTNGTVKDITIEDLTEEEDGIDSTGCSKRINIRG